MFREILKKVEENGFKGSILPISRLKDIELEFKTNFEQGIFDEEFYRERLSVFNFNFKQFFQEAKSIIIVAVPVPQHEVTFILEGNKISTILPPTYLFYDQISIQIEELLNSLLKPDGFQVVEAYLHFKSLAVHSGLAKYGRNNITYIPGMGSFHKLSVFYSDVPYEEDTWKEYELTEMCGKCQACIRNCPTGAISADRFIINAEKCLTFLNEKPSDVAFPDWLDPSKHNCLVGCMICQKVCPLNREHRNWIEQGLEFTEEETNQILQGIPFDELHSITKNKLSKSELDYYFKSLSRNLKILIQRES